MTETDIITARLYVNTILNINNFTKANINDITKPTIKVMPNEPRDIHKLDR